MEYPLFGEVLGFPLSRPSPFIFGGKFAVMERDRFVSVAQVYKLIPDITQYYPEEIVMVFDLFGIKIQDIDKGHLEYVGGKMFDILVYLKKDGKDFNEASKIIKKHKKKYGVINGR
jgi:hypothetical protein